jgi:hypothetical protein
MTCKLGTTVPAVFQTRVESRVAFKVSDMEVIVVGPLPKIQTMCWQLYHVTIDTCHCLFMLTNNTLKS